MLVRWLVQQETAAPLLQARIGRTFTPPSSMTDLSTQMKKIYTTRLLQFEQVRGGREQGAAGMGACRASACQSLTAAHTELQAASCKLQHRIKHPDS